MSSAFFTNDLDRRLTPAREDLAASWLKDLVKAARYVEPTRQIINDAIVNIYRNPNDQSIETQLLYGEAVDVFETKNGWSWIQSVSDGYVGYIKESTHGFVQGDATATHRISNICSFVFPNVDKEAALSSGFSTKIVPNTSYKTTPDLTLSYGSLVRVTEQKQVMSEIADGRFVPSAHLASTDFHSDDPVAESFRFLGVPYLWGGRSNLGVDCSSLIQLVLQACNIKCPRDVDMQERHLGKPIDRDDVRGGDLVFFRDHIGLMVDDSTFIHANDRAMAVSIDDLDEYSRWRAKHGQAPVKMFKRI